MDAERARVTLVQFVLRARRVEEHSLAADPDVLAALCRVEYHVTVDRSTGEATVVREFPPEEQVESAAARVRPITLEQDPVHFHKALTALGTLLTEAGTFESYRQVIKDLRRSWTAAVAPTAPVTAMLLRTSADGATAQADDRTLARAWLYGDVIHADPAHLDGTADFGVHERYLAAVPYIANLIVHTKLTLDLIRHTIEHGLVTLPAALFDGPVVVHGTSTHTQAKVWTADPGTEIPTDATSLPPHWRPIEPGDIDPAHPRKPMTRPDHPAGDPPMTTSPQAMQSTPELSPLPFRGDPPDRDVWLLRQGFGFNRDRWRRLLPDGAWPTQLDTLPAKGKPPWPHVTRRDVFTVAADADTPTGAVHAYVAAAAWGTGTGARGATRCITPISTTEKAAHAGRCIADAVHAATTEGPVAAYRVLHGDGGTRGAVKGLGPSFGTKVLYFAGWDRCAWPQQPLILDQYVAIGVNALTGTDWPLGMWTPEQYAAYLNLAHHWAQQWGCEPDIIERVLFTVGKAPTLAVAALSGAPGLL